VGACGGAAVDLGVTAGGRGGEDGANGHISVGLTTSLLYQINMC